MWRIHRVVGWILLGIFLFTGFYMRFNWGGIDQKDLLMRSLFRTRHIYILMSFLLHELVGIYGRFQPTPGRIKVQKVGSVLMFAGSLVLVVAYFHDPVRKLVEASWGEWGVHLTFAGCFLHVLSSTA